MMEQEQVNGVDVVRLKGSFDSQCVEAVDLAVLPLCAQGQRLVVDCSELSAVNSVCLSFLRRYSQECKARGGSVIFCSLPPAMEKIIRLLNLERTLPISPTLSDAIAFISV